MGRCRVGLVSGFWVLLLSAALFGVALNVPVVKGDSGTIYIRADGSVDPPDAPISTVDNVTYTLTGNITTDADGIVVERDNIVIDGAGQALQGSGMWRGTGMVLSNRDNVTVKNTAIEKFYHGLNLYSNNTVVSRNNITNNYYGICAHLSNDNTISDNNITDNGQAISLSSSSDNSISANNMTENHGDSLVYVSDSYNNTVEQNTIMNNRNYGGSITLLGSSSNNVIGNVLANNTDGIFVEDSGHNVIFGNTITGCERSWGAIFIGKRYGESSDNRVYGNTLENNRMGINFEASNNIVFHNNFVNNQEQVETSWPLNTWDEGYPLGGNHWSNYNATDLYSGPHQDETGSDGVGDTPYVIDENNQDRYPLMYPWSSLPVHNMNTGLGYETIQGAIDAPETLDGHTIFAEAGTYQENVVVNKTICLIGEDKGTTCIDGMQKGHVIDVATNGVSITGFIITNSSLASSYSGIYLYEIDGCNITQNNITNSWDGIHLHESSNNTISGNSITANHNGIFPDSFSDNNTISKNNVADSSNGIWLESHSGHNIISENNVTACLGSYGICISLSEYNSIYANNATNNKDGIYLYESHNSFLTCNNVKGSTEYGIYLWNSGNNTLALNNLTENWLDFGVDAGYLSGFYQSIGSSNLINGKPIYYLMDLENTIITPNDYPNIGYLALVNGNSVVIENISLQGVEGLELVYSKNCSVKNVNIENCTFAVSLLDSDNNTVSNATVSNNYIGILYLNSVNNSLLENVLSGNEYGISSFNSHGNAIRHNSFLNNSQQVHSEQSANIWDGCYPSGGNYWSDYTGADVFSGSYQNETGSDGIGDALYVIDANNKDLYPQMGPFSMFDAGTWNALAYNVVVVSNSTVSEFQFNPSEDALLRFDVAGEEGTAGFCRVTIPKDLLWAEDGQWIILVGGVPITNYTITSDENCTYLYFNYNHSARTVQIQGTHVIPEFPSFLVLQLFMIATLIAVIACRRRKVRCGYSYRTR